MEKSFFRASKLGANLQGVAKGTKTTNDYRPEVVTARALNKFTMNASASTLMNVQDGEFVYMINNPSAESLDGRFLIAKAPAGAKLASTGHAVGAGRPLAFSYSSIWSTMIQMDINAKPLGAQALVEEGFMFDTPTMEGKSALLVPYKVSYKLEPVMNDEGTDFEPITIDGVTYPQVFALVEPVKRVIEKGEEDTEDVEAEVEDETAEGEAEAEAPARRNRRVESEI